MVEATEESACWLACCTSCSSRAYRVSTRGRPPCGSNAGSGTGDACGGGGRAGLNVPHPSRPEPHFTGGNRP